MTIGVAITSYFYGHLVAHALDSVLAQTIKPDQVVIIDDASHDTTASAARLYNIDTVIRKTNFGLRKNFNDILQNIIHTDLMFFLGADNWIHPTYIEKTQQKINDNTKVVSTDCFIVGEYGNHVAPRIPEWYNKDYYLPVWKYPKENIMNRNWIHGSALFDRKIAIEVGGFNDSGGIDYDLWKAFYQRGYQLDKVDEPLLYYRKHRFNYNKTEIKEL